MFIASILFAIIAVAVYSFTSRLRTVSRILLALSIFIVGVLGIIFTLIYAGDRPAGCSQNVYMNEDLGPVENCD